MKMSVSPNSLSLGERLSDTMRVSDVRLIYNTGRKYNEERRNVILEHIIQDEI